MCNADGWLSSAVALVESKVTKAILDAGERRLRVGVMLLHFAPRCDCDGNAPCWDLGLADLLARAHKRGGEWGPLRLDATTLVLVAQGFEYGAHIQRRAAEILKSIETGWCHAGHDRMIDCAIGIGLFPEDGDTARSLLTRADEALRDLRAAGHNAAAFNLRRTVGAAGNGPNRAPTALRPWQSHCAPRRLRF